MKKRLPLAIAALVALLIIWQLRPYKSAEWDIEFDPVLQDGKDRYLDRLARFRNQEDRPNIVLILADDLGLTDISLYGSPHLETPNIDSIGREGVVFDQAYSTAPICSPSRAGLLTGRYQNRFGFDSQPMTRYARTPLEFYAVRLFLDTKPMYPIHNTTIPSAEQILRQGIPPTEILLSEALSAAGYRSHIVGKWHLGYGDLQHPNNRGFDSFFGFIEAFSYFVDPKRPDVDSWQFDEFSERHIWRQRRKGPSAIQENGLEVSEDEHLTDAFAREAVERIGEAGKENRPFFLYLPFSAPHTPFQALKIYTARFKHVEDPRKRIYYAMIAQLDDAVGRILAALDREGLTDDTIVIFSSDNGGATYTGATGNDPLRGGKMSHFEGGLAVPLMIKWPGTISEGSYVRNPVIQSDLFTTLMSAAGLPLPDDRPIDGVDLLQSFVAGKDGNPSANSRALDDNPNHRTLFWRSDYNFIVRWGDWKLLINEKDGSVRLYNLGSDREENHNLADEREDIVDYLREKLKNWDSKMAPPGWPRVMDYYYDEDGEGYWFAT